MNRRLSGGSIAILAAAGVTLVGSLLHVFTFDVLVTSINLSAWSSGIAPLVSLPAVLGLVMAGHVLLVSFGGDVRPPQLPFGLTWPQVDVALGLWSAFVMVSLLSGNVLLGGTSEPKRGVGFWLMLLGTLGLAIGAIARARERGAR